LLSDDVYFAAIGIHAYHGVGLSILSRQTANFNFHHNLLGGYLLLFLGVYGDRQKVEMVILNSAGFFSFGTWICFYLLKSIGFANSTTFRELPPFTVFPETPHAHELLYLEVGGKMGPLY